MLVSAISQNINKGYYLTGNKTFNNKKGDTVRDTSFNSLTPYASKNVATADKLPQLFENINEWQTFCHKQIMGEKLNVIA